MRLILASGSPRRVELLRSIGIEPELRPADLDESVHADETPGEYVRRLAEQKVKKSARKGETVLGADTTVALDGAILGKPLSAAEARSMLSDLSGRRHRVLTGVALLVPEIAGAGAHEAAGESSVSKTRLFSELAITEVEMATLSAREIDWYVETGEPFDKAGAYALQGRGGLFVETLRGSSSNVVGLPLRTTYLLFARAGLDLRAFQSDVDGQSPT